MNETTSKTAAIVYAFFAAVFYALNMPFSKLLLASVQPAMMAAFLYLGAGLGMAVLFFAGRQYRHSDLLARKDLPYVIGMILLDIAAPVLLMYGLNLSDAASSSLLNNFEIVATTLIALFVFSEPVSRRLWLAVTLITLSSVLLSVSGLKGISFNIGSLMVLGAACSWGLENNCTRAISDKNTYEIVMIKGLFSGLGSLLVAFLSRESLPSLTNMALAALLGFVAYGLSIFLYVKAQHTLGASKTSAYYAAAPFIGSALSFFILQETLSDQYLPALFLMVMGAVLVVADTLDLSLFSKKDPSSADPQSR